jgi:dimethylglycine dehydrogenase
VDARGSEPIRDTNGALIGRATHGGYGWRCGKSIALAMVKPEHAAEGSKLSIRILGKDFDAVIIPESPFDGENVALRG